MFRRFFEAGISAQSDGYDAIVIDTMSDSGMTPLRSMLDIPVVSPGRASMLFALMLGNQFGILAQWDKALTRYRKATSEYGLTGHCAAIDHFDEPPDFALLPFLQLLAPTFDRCLVSAHIPVPQLVTARPP